MIKAILCALLLPLVPAFGGCAPKSDSLGDFDHLGSSIDQQVLRGLMATHDIPGLALAASYKGEDRFVSLGVVDRASGNPVTRDTIFEIGSVSKLFTVTLAVLAEQKGAMALDAPIGDYIEEPAGTPLGAIAVRHLATHTAGGFPLQLPAGIETEADLFAYYRAWNPEHPPGTMRHYANPSIGLLGLIVARVQEKKFAELAEQDLFPAIGVDSTFINVPGGALGRYAWGHNRRGERVRVNDALLADEAYGVKTTSADLLEFLKVGLDGDDCASPIARAVHRTHTSSFDTGVFEQAMIWEKYAYPLDPEALQAGNAYEMILEAIPVAALNPADSDGGPFVLSKAGSTGGFGAYVLMIPHEDLALVLLANKNYPNRERVEVLSGIAEAVLSPGQ